MKLIIFLVSRAKGVFALAVLCGLLAGATSAGLISVIGNTLSGSSHALTGMLAFAALAIVGLLSRFSSQLLLNHLHHGEIHDLRVDLGRRILATPLRRLEEMGSHRLMTALVTDVQSMGNSLVLLPAFFIDLTIVLGCLTYMAWLSWNSFLGTLVFLGVGGLTYWLPQRRGLAILRQAHEHQSSLHKYFRGLSDGIKELKLHRERRQAFIRERFEPNTAALRSAHTHAGRYFAATMSWGMFLFLVFIGLLLFVVPQLMSLGPKTMVGYTLAALYLQQPINSLMSNIPFLGQGNIALQHIEKLALASAENDSGADRPLLPAPRSFERLEVKGITHAYHRDNDERHFTLGPLHLQFSPGELVFIIGGNGSGKTTLAKLLTGLYAPESGEMLLDGKPVTDENREHYRQLFSAVFSDFHLFDSLLGLITTERAARMQGYLERLQLDRKVRLGADGALSTTELSQGQRKRLALLTAWMEDRPIYLFDEWAADQDPSFKDVFYLELLPDLKRAGKTVVVISHDNRYFHVADRVIQLESGQLVEVPAGSKKERLA
ncbi:cyclic peptide export ABC transporter [Archangium sp.]|uniref:cyclic peptide export ABC transporter n=1 Tax=Archangium sp. TaxID=1872627 RepID=UPI00389AB44B